MNKAYLILIALSFSTLLLAQNNTSLLINITQSANHYRYDQLLAIPYDPDEILVSPTTDQYGISFRQKFDGGRFFELMAAGRIENRRSYKVNASYEELANPSYQIKKGDLHMRFEAGKMWQIPQHEALEIGVSGAFDPRFTDNDFKALDIDKISSSFRTYEVTMQVIPQFSYNINNLLIANIKVPMGIYNYTLASGSRLNGSLPILGQEFSRRKSQALPLQPTYTISVGYFLRHDRRAKEITYLSY